MASLGPEHVSRVRVLYKTIMRLHRGMPLELRGVGDQYVRDEFKRHKDAELQFVGIFMNEWANYAITLAKQLGKRTAHQSLGVPLNQGKVDEMSDEQVTQLFELFTETQKPRDPNNPMGHNPLFHTEDTKES